MISDKHCKGLLEIAINYLVFETRNMDVSYQSQYEYWEKRILTKARRYHTPVIKNTSIKDQVENNGELPDWREGEHHEKNINC